MNGRIQKRGRLRALATAAPALALCCLLAGPALSAGQKTSGSNTITDDLATGFGGSVGLTGTGIEVTGGLGQAMTVTALNILVGSTKAESGYFSMVVDTPTATDFYKVFFTSLTITWMGTANPEGTQYIIELSTAFNFTALASSSVFTGSPGTLAGLTNGVTYYSRIKATYGDSDESDWLIIGSTKTIFATFTSIQTGNWSQPSTWNSGTMPTPAYAVTIAAGHVVTIDVMTAVSSTATINGTLRASRLVSSSWTLTGGDINVNPGGWLDYGTEASPIPDTYLAHLMLSSGTYAGQYGLIVNNGGNFTVRGSTKTPYSYATESITTGQTYLKVYGSTSTDGWQAGDVITIGPTSGFGTGTTSSRTITSITGSNPYTVNWSGGALGTPRMLSSTSPIIVANLTRNVLVRSSGTSTSGNTAYIQNLARNATSFSLTSGEFAYLGTNSAGKYGIMFDGALMRGSISSSTVRNGYYGIYLNSSSNNTWTGNNSYSNSSHGISVYNSSNNNTLTGNNSYSNSSYGIYVFISSNNTFAGGSLGYDGAGSSKPNSTAEIDFDSSASIETLTLKGTRVNPAFGVSTAGMNTAGKYLLSYNQDADTGTVRIWGNYQLAGSTLTLDYATQLYTSTATAPKLMRGAGHSASVVAAYDAYAVSQLITITYRSGLWHVDGTSTGADMITFSGSQALDIPAGNPQFRLNFISGGSPQEGDIVDFVLTAASNDANIQKKLLFGPAASTFNQGRSKLEVSPTAGIVLRGKDDGTANTLVDWLSSASTYYTFVDSGAFTAAYSSFTNMDPGGIQLSGTKGVAISSSTFDYLGFASGTNTYITARSLNSNATFYNVTFALSRSSAGYQSAHNVRTEGDETSLNWTFMNPAGNLSGEAYDDDPNAKVTWAESVPPTLGITDPPNGSYKYVLANIAGTAADNVAVSQVNLSIRNMADARYWNGGSFNSIGEMFFSVTLFPSSWTFTSPPWVSGSTYTIVAKAMDSSGNWSTVYATSTFTYDNIAPSAVVDLATGTVSTGTIALNWVSPGDNGANDPLNNAVFTIQYSTDSAVAWSTAAAQVINISTSGVNPGTSQYYTLSGLSANTSYYFRLWTNDAAGNYSAQSNLASTLMLPNAVADPVILTVNQTNFSIIWNTAGNLPGTQYFAEASADMAFTLNTLSTVTTATNYTFTGLIPNTVYFARVKTLGSAGVDSAYVSFGSTATLANQIASAQVSAVHVTSATISWDANSNPEGTFFDISISSDNFTTFNYSTTTDLTYFTFTGLTPNSTYYFKAAGINSDGLKSAQITFPEAYTYAAAPVKHTVSFTAVSASSVTAQWLANSNPSYTQYYVGVSTSANFTGTGVGPGSWTAATSLLISPLNPYTTYYFRTKAKDFIGRETAYTSLGGTTTLSGTDVIAPTVTDLQSGDDTWRGGASGAYKVYFADYGSGLSKFQARITTAPGATGTLIADWTDVVTNIVVQTYTSDWQLPGAAFGGIPENTTCYVSVRVYDNSSNVTVSTDVFYVKRDITAPAVTNNAVTNTNWTATDPGPIYDVNFADALSGLRYIQYSVSSQAGTASANILGWMDIAAVSSSPDYTTDWGVNFTGLLDAATNYISARAIDTAGNITTVTDAFRILKNIKGPLVAITAPNSAYVSTITAIAGLATKRIEIAPVDGSELALLKPAEGKYWDGAGFNSASQFWLNAVGVNTWSVDVSTFGLVENSSYTAVARARDINGKYSAAYSTFTFTIDATVPTVSLSTPLAGTTIYALDLVEGSAADASPGAGISAVEVGLKRIVDGKWWNFQTSAWGEVAVASRAVGGTTWRFYPDATLKGNIASGQAYFVTAQAKDAAQPPNASPFGIVGATFTVMDTVPPGQVTQITASSGATPGRILLTWIASGDDGAEVMLGAGSKFAVQYATWPAVVLSTLSAQVLVSTENVMPGSTQYYTVINLTPSVTYYLALWVQDDAGLWSAPSPLASAKSGESLNDQVSGHVRMPSGTGITGVFVEAFDMFGLTARTTYTANDGLGSFLFSGLVDGFYRIQATWVASDIASTVSKDGIPMGYADVDFILSTEYELASISGSVPLAVKPIVLAGAQALLRQASEGQAAPQPAETVELYQGARRIAVTRPDAQGNFSIRNLLPGTYTVHFPQNPGLKDMTVTLQNGENAVLSPLGELLIKDSVFAYPNPARNSITFRLQSGILTGLRKVVSIFGIDGRVVGEIKEDNPGWVSGPAGGLVPGEHKIELNTSKLASGVYIYSVRVQDAASGGSKKIIGKFAIIK